MGKRRACRVSREAALAGKARALELVNEGLKGHGEMVTALRELTGCSVKSAKNWIRDARKTNLVETASIDIGDIEGTRIALLQVWNSRSRIYRGKADGILNNSKKSDEAAIRFDRMAFDFDKLIAEYTGLSKIPMEADLTQDGLRTSLVNAIDRHRDAFTRLELGRMLEIITAAINTWEIHRRKRGESEGDYEFSVSDFNEPDDGETSGPAMVTVGQVL